MQYVGLPMKHGYTTGRLSYLMRCLLVLLLLGPISMVYGQSVGPGTVLTFYITDPNLVTNHRGVMTISTAGLVDFTINGTPIAGPSSMVETGIDTGVFQLQLYLPGSINGRPLQNGDVVLMTYHQPADYSGNPQTITQSVVLSSIPSTPMGSAGQSSNIGQYYTLQLYAPNYNLDSQVPDDIPLNMVEVHMGGVSTTLADSAFDIGTGVLRETGPNTDTFSATFKIPKEIDGFPVDIGSTLEFRVVDYSQKIPSESSIFLRIGTHYQPGVSAVPPAPMPRAIIVQTPNSKGITVDFLNSTVLEGIVEPVCFPSSGSFFPIGTTTVTCSAKNAEGTSVLRSFSVTVGLTSKPIPHWVKNLTTFWCHSDIQDQDFKNAIAFLDSNNIITVPKLPNQGAVVDKTGICSWTDGKISDDRALQLFYPLIR